MKWFIGLIISLLASIYGSFVWAQTPFSVTWGFDGNAGAASSNQNVSGGGAAFVGVNLSGIAPYAAGQTGQAANIQNWSVSTCNYSEYVQVTIQPQNGEKITLTQLSFAFNRSNAGPQELRVRSSIDGFSSDISVQGVSDGFQQAVIGLSGGGYTDQGGAIVFRIYACNLISQGGTLRLDNLVINGTVTQTPTPVELLYFRAQLLGTAVQVSWATAWERNADRFIVQRSRDLVEFVNLTSLPAVGDATDRQAYHFTDHWPNAGANYYRLRQVDRDGLFTESKPVGIVLTDATPSLTVLENPSQQASITIATRNLPNPILRLITLSGQAIPIDSWLTDAGNWVIKPRQALSPGLYIVQVQSGDLYLISRVLIY